jgi:alpha-tubulin suppressor-like RCC1 family protein
MITCKAPRNILSRYPWETNKSYSGFVSSPISCVGHLIEGSKARIDQGWTVCSNCSDCCFCRDCPECRQSLDLCACTTTSLPCTPSIPIGTTAARGLCLPPEFRCYWAPRQDPTFSQLQCDLLDFTGRLFLPPQPLVLILGEKDFLHPDLALRKTIPFYVSMDGQTWISGCVAYPIYGSPASQNYADGRQTCITNDPTVGAKWTGTFVFTERYNLTRFKPDIAPMTGGTRITFVGEGFVQTSDIRCKFGYRSLPDFFDYDNPCDSFGNITGVVYNEVPGAFVDSFTVVCVSPAVDLRVHRLGNPPVNADGLVVDPVCAPYSKNQNYVAVPTEITINGSPVDYTASRIDFIFAMPWEITRMSPSHSPTMGGLIITLFGPYFRHTEDIMCKFGDLRATEIVWLSEISIGCRNPSVEIHKYVNVSVSLDGQTWSEATNTSLFEYDGVRNVLTFGENVYGQLGFNVIGKRIFSGFKCLGGKTQGFPCSAHTDCPSGSCEFVNQTNLNYEPTFIDQLFARNVTSISMGQTHTIIVSSQTYNDTWGTKPRRGVIYTWGGNMAGQLGIGFSGPSLQYNLSHPSVLVCASEDTYMLDVRYDGRTILGLPSNWPSSSWQIPTCLKLQDVTSQGKQYIETLVVFNPFHFESVIQVAAGSFHSLALTENGNVFSWGWNNDGQLGLGPLEMRTSIPYPTQLMYFLQRNRIVIKRIAAGFSHSVAVATDGILYTWGNNKYGQLAQGDYVNRRFPTAVRGFKDSQGADIRVQDVKCGLYHCLVLTEKGQVWSFGSNSRGQLGTCSTSPIIDNNLIFTCTPSPLQIKSSVYTSPKPQKVEFANITDYLGNLLGAPRVTQIATGAFHSMAIAIPCSIIIGTYTDPCADYDEAAGDLYVWGNNRYGQLGVGRNSDGEYRPLPVLVPALFTISSQCKSTSYVLCIKGQYTDGCCYPANNYFVSGMSVRGIGAGSWHTVLYLVNRERVGYRRSLYPVERVLTMGNNDEGQLGLGDLLLRNTPSPINTNMVKFHDVGGGHFQSIFTQGCPPNDQNVCNNHGLCYEQGVCECYPGYRGLDCLIECDGGATNVCSSHGNASLAFDIAAWRRNVVRAASGRSMRERLNLLFYPYFCSSVAMQGRKFGSEIDCLSVCSVLGGACLLREAKNISSSDVLHFMDALVIDFPAMKTAVDLVIEDWPLVLFLKGVRQWSFSYEARVQKMSASTQGPSNGYWQESDVLQIVEMLQNRSTCWRSYDCPSGSCQVIRGQTRTTASTSGFQAGPGCRDGWTARIAFSKRIEEIDQVWSNLEEENLFCDPLAVANYYGITREQAQFMWSTLELDPNKILDMLMSSSNPALSAPFLGGLDFVSVVLHVWEAFNDKCFQVTLSEAREGVH